MKKILFIAIYFVLNINNISAKQISVNYYNNSLFFNIEDNFLSMLKESVDVTNGVYEANTFYEYADLENYETVLLKLGEYKKQFGLDDFGLLFLVQKLSIELVNLKTLESPILFQAFVLNKIGYDINLITNNKEYILYGAITRTGILHSCNFAKNAIQYYCLDFQHECVSNAFEVDIYSKNNGKKFMMSDTLPFLSNTVKSKIIKFEYNTKNYVYDFNYDLTFCEYLNDLPFLIFDPIYLKYGFSESATKTLLQPLEKHLHEYKNIEEKINFLLAFTQSLPYKEDILYHGKEKYCFPEESLAYDYLDCEDKSILFAYLVNKLLKRETVLISYATKFNGYHANIGVKIENNPKYAKVNHKGINYIICDPTGFERVGIQADFFGDELTVEHIFELN